MSQPVWSPLRPLSQTRSGFAARDVFPWATAVLSMDGSIASGALIRRDLVLTAAHVPVRRYDLVIVGGTSTTLRDGHIRTVLETHPYPHYDPSTFAGDLQVLRIDSVPDEVQRLEIAQKAPRSVSSAILVCWGRTREGDPAPGDLRQLVVPTERAQQIVSGDRPPCSHRLFEPVEGGRAVWYGDSGAPLLVCEEGQWKASALMSFHQPGRRSDMDCAVVLTERHIREWLDGMLSKS